MSDEAVNEPVGQGWDAIDARASQLDAAEEAEATKPPEAQVATSEAPREEKDGAADDEEVLKALVEETAEKYKLVTDGEEEEVELEELIKRAQKAKAADKKFADAAKLRKDVDEFLEKLQVELERDPKSFLRNYGIDTQRLLDEWVAEALDEQNPDPERQRLREKDKLLEARLRETQTAEVRRYEQEYRRDIAEALEKSGEKATDRALSEIAEYLLDDPTGDVEEAVARYQEEVLNDKRTWVSSMSLDQAKQSLGAEGWAHIRKLVAEEVRAASKGAKKATSRTPDSENTSTEKRLTWNDLLPFN